MRDPVWLVAASVITTDRWSERGNALPDFNALTRNASREAYETAGVDPADLDLVDLHDCFATAAGPRQIEGATALPTHVLGLGNPCAVHILERGSGVGSTQ